MAEIHHTIKSIGKTFTFEEWIKWNNENRSNGWHTRVVYECNGYKFNDCDVCINPDTIDVYEHTSVQVAEMAEGKWVEGVSCLWYSSPCSWGKTHYRSKDEASRVATHTRDNSNYTSDKRWAQGVLEATRQVIGKRKFKQLTLF